MFGSGCAVRRGFFVLRECGQPAIGLCATCGRSVCAEHSALGTAAMLCVECQAREQTTSDNTDDSTSTAWDNPAWPVGYRHHYYTQQHYQPVDSVARPDPYYDDYDVRSFDREPAEPPEIDDAGDPGLLDS
jgi:hypothetical protein